MKIMLGGADALVIVTEWKEFRSADLDTIKQRLRAHAVDAAAARPARRLRHCHRQTIQRASVH